MLLAIDVGNTQTVFALCRDTVLRTWRFATDPHRTEDEYGVLLNGLMQQAGYDPREIDGAILSSVVPDAVFAIKRYCNVYLQQPLFVVRPEVPLSSLKVMIERPSELGADRLVNAVAARSFCQDAMIIIDFGTATTFDAVDADGNYLGGAIAPGVNLSLEALQNAAARLHGIRIRKAEKGIGSNTTAAMQSGLYYGYGGLVEGIVRQIKEELGGKAVVIATGGLSELFGRDNPLVDRVEPDLTVSGLMLLYEEYQKADA